jgi:hypothetical protein
MATYSEAIAAVENGTNGQPTFGYRGSAWPSPKAIVWDSADETIHLWLETDQGTWSPSSADKAATDYVLTPYNGANPPR